MSQPVWVGIDLGTSGCRAIAINETDDIVAESKIDFTHTALITTEQSPFSQWHMIEKLLDQLFPQIHHYQVLAIAVNATSGSVMLTDKQGNPISSMLMYNDARARVEAESIKQIAPVDSAVHGATSSLAKLLHLLKQTQNKTVQLLHQADWINYQLGADLGVTDYNNALKSGYDPVQQKWPDWLTQCLPNGILPTVVSPGSQIGYLKQTWVDKWQLKSAPALIAGTTDSIAAFIATGAKNIGEAVTSLGSTLVLKLITDQPVFVPEQGIYSHKLGDKWLIGGASNTGGAVLKHFFTPQQLSSLSQQIDLKQQAPDYYPLLSPGERFPICDPQLAARMTPRPTQDSLFLYGLLSGIAQIETMGYQRLQACSNTVITSIRTTGGGAKNSVWQTIRQKLLDVPFVQAAQTEAAYGTALLAKNRLQYI